MSTTTHACPWTRECHCIRDGSLCVCGHQHGDHGGTLQDPACCDCTTFEAIEVNEQFAEAAAKRLSQQAFNLEGIA